MKQILWMDVSYYDLRKKLIKRVNVLTTSSDISGHGTLNFIMQTCIFFIFHTQIKIYCKICMIVVLLNIFQFTLIHVPENLKNAVPIQDLTLLRQSLLQTRGYKNPLDHFKELWQLVLTNDLNFEVLCFTSWLINSKVPTKYKLTNNIICSFEY